MANAAIFYIAVAAKKKGPKILLIVGIALLVILLAPIIVISSALSVFKGYGSIGSSEFNVMSTELYQNVKAVYTSYVEETLASMQEDAQAIEDEHMDFYYVDEINPDTGETERLEKWYCTVDVQYQFNDINLAYLFAVLSCSRTSEFMSAKKAYMPSEDELKKFWDKIAPYTIEESTTEEGKDVYSIYNAVMTTEEIAEEFFSEETEKERFLKSLYYLEYYMREESYD